MAYYGRKRESRPDPVWWFWLGLILFFVSLICLGNSNMKYRQQLSQVDWPTTQATVYQVDKHMERSGRNHTRDCYDVQYRYVVEGQTYTGAAWHQWKEIRTGDVFPVKYNPDHPSQSNYILEPSDRYLVCASVFCAIGAGIMGVSLVRILWMRRAKRNHV